MERVSVLIPVYNGERYVRGAVESALAQGEDVGEIIVSDDGSSDETPRILNEFGESIRSVRQPQNLGLTANHNLLLGLARAEWVTFLHQDDALERGSVGSRLQAARPDVGFVASASTTIDDRGATTGRVRSESLARSGRTAVGTSEEMPGDWEALACFLRGNPVHMGTVLLRRSLVSQVGSFRDELTYAMDYNYWLRCLLRTQIAYVPEPLLRHRHSDRQMTSRYQLRGRRVDNRAGRAEVYLALADAYRTAREIHAPLPEHLARTWRRELFIRRWSAAMPDALFVLMMRLARPIRSPG